MNIHIISFHLKNRSRTTPERRPGGSSTSCSWSDWFMVHVVLRLLIIIVKVTVPSWLPARPWNICKFVIVILIVICNWATCECLPRTGIAYSVYNRSRTTSWCRWPPELPLSSCTAVTCEYSSHFLSSQTSVKDYPWTQAWRIIYIMLMV